MRHKHTFKDALGESRMTGSFANMDPLQVQKGYRDPKLAQQAAQKIKELNKAIDTLQEQWQTWLYNFQDRYARKHQGVAEEYFTISIPPEITQQQYFSARYIEYNG